MPLKIFKGTQHVLPSITMQMHLKNVTPFCNIGSSFRLYIINLGRSVVYIEGSHVIISFSANSVDSDEMHCYTLFHLDLHCLSKWHLRVSSI